MPRPDPVMVVHGPEIFDAGEASWLIGAIRPARTIVAGVMARTAAEESGLPLVFDGAPPSRILRALAGPAYLANHGKTPVSGRIFGEIVASRSGEGGLVQVECSDRAVIVWDNGDASLARMLASRTGFRVEACRSGPEGGSGMRRIRGCIRGEPVFVNGIIIGHATGDTVVLQETPSGIRAVSGLDAKEHGLEKLARHPPASIATAWCKSGPLRRVGPAVSARTNAPGRITVIDHCGHELYRRIGPDCCGVVAIGDDTTAACGHICAHRGIPVLGITDGDLDAILPATFAAGSVVVEVQCGRDDDVGREVAALVPPGPVDWDRFVGSALADLRGRARITLDRRGNVP